jgi:hypothetical protein
MGNDIYVSEDSEFFGNPLNFINDCSSSLSPQIIGYQV